MIIPLGMFEGNLYSLVSTDSEDVAVMSRRNELGITPQDIINNETSCLNRSPEQMVRSKVLHRAWAAMHWDIENHCFREELG